MTAQPIERTDLGTDLFEALDFDPPCEHSEHPTGSHHSGPAWALIGRHCSECGGAGELFICQRGFASSLRLQCIDCGSVCPRDESWRVIALVRP